MLLAPVLALLTTAPGDTLYYIVPQIPPPPPFRPMSRITMYLGERSLDSGDYSPVEDQGTFGIEFQHQAPGGPIGFEFGFMGSYDDSRVAGIDVEGRTGEIYAGIYKRFGDEVVHPYIGGGISFINSDVEVGPFDDDDSSFAAYLHGGVTFDVTPVFSLGLDVRTLFGSDMDIGGVSTDADYGQFALTLGFGF